MLVALGIMHASLAQGAEGTIRLAAFGDSLMAGYGLSSTDGFTKQLEDHLNGLGYSVEIINQAISGNTTADGLNRIGQVVHDRPDGVLLGLGSNDALRHLAPDAAHQNLNAIIERLRHENIPVMLIGAQAPLNWGLRYKSNFDSVFKNLADDHDLIFYPFILTGVALVPSLNQTDGLHPNAAGVQVMVRNMEPYLTSFLDSLRS